MAHDVHTGQPTSEVQSGPQEELSPVEQLVAHLGGPSATATRFGIKQPSVSEWLARKRLPVSPINRVLEAERLTEGKFTRYMLRPDIYGSEPSTEVDSAA